MDSINSMSVACFHKRLRVSFTMMYPSAFAALTPVPASVLKRLNKRGGRGNGQRIVALVSAREAQDITELEQQILTDLRECSRRTFHGFKDEYQDMFNSAITQQHDEGYVVVSLGLEDNSLETITEVPEAMDVSMTPVRVVVKPGAVHIQWCIVPIDDPTEYELPIALRAHQALGAAARARKTIRGLERKIATGEHTAESIDEVIQFLSRHGFLIEDEHERTAPDSLS